MPPIPVRLSGSVLEALVRGLGVSAERVTDTYDSLVRAAAAEAVTAV